MRQIGYLLAKYLMPALSAKHLSPFGKETVTMLKTVDSLGFADEIVIEFDAAHRKKVAMAMGVGTRRQMPLMVPGDPQQNCAGIERDLSGPVQRNGYRALFFRDRR